jgi:hypothetical protein
MKRKLISYDVFESIQEKSLSNAQRELVEAEPILAQSLETDNLELVSFTNEAVLYESSDGTYVHANYKIENGKVVFENIEQLTIDTDSEKKVAREKLSTLVDALLDNNDTKANSLFKEFMDLPQTKRSLQESMKLVGQVSTGRGKKSKFRGRHRAGGHAAATKAARTRARNDRLTSPAMKKKIENLLDSERKKLGGRSVVAGKGQRHKRIYVRRAGAKKMCEWNELANNAFGYINFRELGPVISESSEIHDDQGNVTAVAIPSTKTRNEGKLLSFNWKTMATDVKVCRSGARKLSEDSNFCKAMAELKKHNNVSDATALEETLENIVGTWPSVLYATENELTAQIKKSLTTINASNFDDQTCAFMAEGILRTAHNAFADRVSKIMSLAGVKPCEDCKDKYPQFKETAEKYFATLDESNAGEMQMFVDLYEALREIYEIANESQDEIVREETANHLDELKNVIEGKSQPSFEVASAAAAWLQYIVETNLETKDWDVSNAPHITAGGDHPAMAEKARKSFSPAGDASGSAPEGGQSSDGKAWGSADDSSWTGIGGKDTYPDLNNPYVPKSAEFTMPKEKGVDKEDGLAFDSGETWPSLQNPYVPKAVEPKMKSDDLVVDK